ncbi:hypothetical protein [Chitinophaga sancti]|uniref:Uncharacterized protein n=1 Tax=Chitinophaga sancti TaxID=1004 RepID=A0A1K1S2I5_9BACT|nr:hypothetical protein [Chitinophaga sancti]WQD59642.1 hypothetical protein U0033_17280 [Chitinophaga sancti]WQG88227.1 hypothetical protein SR876_25185 [Chitinophaga sancti]SFW78518.1 hypothetical protein SAMN05661012_04664 [Chitinophaga sancti]
MKKTNFILSIIGLLSIIGGAVAFKSQHRFIGALFCYTTVGRITPNFQIVYAPISTRYSTTHPEATLFCAIPGPNVTYQSVRVNQDM